MALEKQSLNNFLPDGFETEDKDGYKTNFSDDKISTGFQKDVADILSGPNLNNLIDVIGKNTNTLNNYVEYLNSLSVNKTPIIDSNNQLNSTQIGLKVYSATETYLLNDLVTTIQDGKVLFYKSLVASNTGNPLTNTDYWEEVKLGGGSGLEICDIGMALYVDETKGLRRYLNGQIVDINENTQAFLNRLQEITTLHPSLLCTEEEWQAAKTMSAFGQVGKFVFNYSGDKIVSVRLPRVVNVQGLFDLQNLGMAVDESLPNIKAGKITISDWGDIETEITGAWTGSMIPNSTNLNAGRTANEYFLSFNASRCSSTYQDNAPVQQEAIQYPYFIQIATGSETENNIINDIELNNPYSLFDSKYSDHELNNLSWLKSSGQWNAKAVYPTAYDKLLKIYNGTETVEGLSVKLSTEIYTDYDFVLNTADETFRLPLLNGSEDLPGGKRVDLELLASGSPYIAPANGWLDLRKGTSSGQFIQLQNINGNTEQKIYGSDGGAISTSIKCKKGDSVLVVYSANGTTYSFGWSYAQGNGSLYYYVGETVQNANLIDAGRIGEQLATKTDKKQASWYSSPASTARGISVGSAGSTFLAPGNGEIFIGGKSSAANNYVSITNQSNSISNILIFNGSNQVGGKSIRCSQGQTISYDYYGMSELSLRFIPNNGEV